MPVTRRHARITRLRTALRGRVCAPRALRTALPTGVLTTLVAACVLTGPGEAAASVASTPLTFDFKTLGFQAHDLPRESHPYARSDPIARIDAEPHDRNGVRIVVVAGRRYDHPVAQATFGLNNLESYRVSGDNLYLDRAAAQARRLMDRAKRHGGAWYLPYPFRFDLHGLAGESMVPPWFSAMAQGQALSLFVRLYEVTGEPQYRTAADAVFASFLRPRATSRPWTVWIDTSGYLWLEEYAGPRPDRTYNGQIFAAWGLWDYWRLTDDPRAGRLWDGALTTIAAYAPTIRNPRWISSYCLSHQWSTVWTYHEIHIQQLATLYTLSHDARFAQYAETFVQDYPPPVVHGVVRFAVGVHTGYVFAADGRVVRRATVTLIRPSSAPADQRIRVRGQPGLWYRMTAGALAGYYVQEQPAASRVVLHGRYLGFTWSPARVGHLPAGRAVTGYTFDSSGSVTGSRRVHPAEATTFSVSQTAQWNAERYALAATGPLTGYWIPVVTITLR